MVAMQMELVESVKVSWRQWCVLTVGFSRGSMSSIITSIVRMQGCLTYAYSGWMGYIYITSRFGLDAHEITVPSCQMHAAHHLKNKNLDFDDRVLRGYDNHVKLSWRFMQWSTCCSSTAIFVRYVRGLVHAWAQRMLFVEGTCRIQQISEKARVSNRSKAAWRRLTGTEWLLFVQAISSDGLLRLNLLASNDSSDRHWDHSVITKIEEWKRVLYST